MAVNENVNKVVYGNSTLIDLTNDTVVPEALVSGYTAHDRSGATVTGTLELPSSSSPLPVEKGGTNANTASAARTNLDVYSKSEVTNAIVQSTAEAVKRVSKTVTIPAGTSSLQEVQIDFSDVIPTGKNAILLNVTLEEYVLPYCDNTGAVKTWIYQWHRANHILTIKNLSSVWNNTTVILEVDMRQ